MYRYRRKRTGTIKGTIKGIRYEWRFLKWVNKKGLPLPI